MDNESLLAELALGKEACDTLIHQLIVNELTPIFDLAEEAEEHWAEQVVSGNAALNERERFINELDAEIDGLRVKAAELKNRINNRRVSAEKRIQARQMEPFYESEINALLEKRQSAKDDYDTALVALNHSRSELRTAQATSKGAGYCMIHPFETKGGQACDAFIHYINSHLCEIILTAGPEDPRWESAMKQLEILCKVSGYRTDKLSQEDSRQARNFWDNIRDQYSPEVTPSGQDISNAAQLGMAQWAEDRNFRDAPVEDLRGVKLPRHISTDVRERIRNKT